MPVVLALPRARHLFAAALLAAWLVGCTASSAATPPPSGSCVVANAANQVELSAKDVTFSAPCIEAAAGQPIVIHFSNQESVPHNVAVYTNPSKSEELIRGDIITGPGATTTVTVPAQPPGQLYFECNVHNSMNGSIVVTGAPGGSSGTS